MDWKEIYKSRLTTAEQAVKKIKSGDRIVIAHATGEPVHVTDALVANAQAYENVEIIHMVSMGKSAYCAPGMEKHFRHNSFFIGGTTRAACAEGRADITPVYFSKEPELLRTNCKPDAALVQVTPPDEHGFVSLGISVDYTMEAVKQAGVVIAQVNKYMPRIHGDSFVHVSEISDFVEFDEPILELPNPKITDVEREIGRHCASLISDGDCLQLGIGAIPDAVLLFLKDKKDLGIHSEMISDGVVELVEAGVITNKKKNLHPGKSILTFAMGTRRLYDYLNDNPAVGIYPVDYVNDPLVIAQNDNMVSINSCVQVDLMGQVVSTSVGPKQISGVGGQVDFVRGATMSKNGRSIMAMPSTAAKGAVSKIVSLIDEGAAVTTSRYDVQYVVTEYGIADLKGVTLRERAVRLIRIAHPDFRPQLIESFEKKFCCKYDDQD
ncbi:MAG: acetyl-CoA hydrolase/transferase C-terminal domain-containing protein [Christensenella sp.]|uniref:acetyl-CoA hydrolase/transferase family protein n=1 Tax=Christensenella sp. TaxID=1935934 RepID=UPI002B2132B5|nr:acetyl-CoA hydrolase/transferase C-terminal domain-containing protein [Christensenella sp.]MEA5004400.1 acetyl-CoA hydrolase/transferase C-terminal domain-containing protein [Christensenella sp.]